MANTRTMGFLLAGALVLAGCGDSATSSQISAREQATKHACDRAQACDLIGAGLTYQNRDDCNTQVSGLLQQAWPSAECEGHVDQVQLNACLAGIDAVQCANAPANLALLFLGACAKDRICSANSPG